MSSALTPDDHPLQHGLRELAGILLSETNLDVLLQSVTSLAAQSLNGCDAASISLLQGGRTTTPVCSASLAREVDQSQYDTGQGPCLEAIDTSATVRVDSFADDNRWPRFAERAVAQGVHSSLSVPLAVASEVIGALNMYSTSAKAFEGQEEQGGLFAHQASITLANAHALRRAEQLAQQLAQALENRDTIGQAKGIIMAAQNLSSDAAFDVLRRASQRSNRKLHEVAREVVERRDQVGSAGDN